MSVSLSATGLGQLQRALEQAPAQATRALLTAMTRAVLLLQREVMDSLPSHSGLTRASVGADAFVQGAGVLGVVGSSQPVAAFLEFGTRPHMPPVQALEGWVRDKLGLNGADARRVAFLVARKIARKGAPALKLFEKALAHNRGQINTLFETACADLARQMNGGVA